mgnify:CR=1 FL=1
MKNKLSELKETALREIEKVSNLEILNDLRVKYLGKKRWVYSNHEGNGEHSSWPKGRIWKSDSRS